MTKASFLWQITLVIIIPQVQPKKWVQDYFWQYMDTMQIKLWSVRMYCGKAAHLQDCVCVCERVWCISEQVAVVSDQTPGLRLLTDRW